MESELQKIADEQLDLVDRIDQQARERGLPRRVLIELSQARNMTLQVSAQPTERRKLHMLTQGSLYLGRAKGRVDEMKHGTETS